MMLLSLFASKCTDHLTLIQMQLKTKTFMSKECISSEDNKDSSTVGICSALAIGGLLDMKYWRVVVWMIFDRWECSFWQVASGQEDSSIIK